MQRKKNPVFWKKFWNLWSYPALAGAGVTSFLLYLYANSDYTISALEIAALLVGGYAGGLFVQYIIISYWQSVLHIDEETSEALSRVQEGDRVYVQIRIHGKIIQSASLGKVVKSDIFSVLVNFRFTHDDVNITMQEKFSRSTGYIKPGRRNAKYKGTHIFPVSFR